MMKITAIKKLPTAKWRELGSGDVYDFRRRWPTKQPSYYSLMINTQDETFELQLTEDEVRDLVTDMILELPPKKAKRKRA